MRKFINRKETPIPWNHETGARLLIKKVSSRVEKIPVKKSRIKPEKTGNHQQAGIFLTKPDTFLTNLST